MSLKAIGLTFVRYEIGDPFGKLMGWASLCPVFIAFGGFTSLMMFRRELQTIFFCLGLSMSEVVNQTLKRIFHMPRPATCHALEVCDSHGMPSSHSQYMCFFSIYCSLLVLYRLRFSDSFSKYFSLFLPWPFAIATMCSRVYLGYHTTPQIIAGALVGLTMGTWWWLVVDRTFRPHFAAWSETSICRYLCIKDDAHIPNVLQFEYNNSIAARRNLEKAVSKLK